MTGRTRVQIPARRSDVAYFERVIRELPTIEDVEGVDANPVTGSVLIHHGEDFVSIIQKALDKQLFDVTALENARPGPVLTSRLAEKLSETDHLIHEATHGRFDLNSVVMVGLVGAGTFQILRGAVLPAGATLLWYAFGIAWARSPKVVPVNKEG